MRGGPSVTVIAKKCVYGEDYSRDLAASFEHSQWTQHHWHALRDGQIALLELGVRKQRGSSNGLL